jgi:hypothetical protein
MKLALAAVPALALTASAGAVDIYLLSSGDPTTDNAALQSLSSFGHTVTVGVEYTLFDGSQLPPGTDTVYLQSNFNWGMGMMPSAGQQGLITFVNGGGRLVTSEWVTYYTDPVTGSFNELAIIIPLQHTFTYGTPASATYTQATADPALNAGLPSSFTFPLTSYAGTEIFTTAKATAVTYYTSTGGNAGLAGWSVGQGRVLSFSTTCGPSQVTDATFARLFSNAMGGTGGGGPCYGNCDGSTTTPILNVADFTCFLQRYAAGDSYANCDNSTQPPVLNVGDFTCFLQRYAAGCP